MLNCCIFSATSVLRFFIAILTHSSHDKDLRSPGPVSAVDAITREGASLGLAFGRR